MFTALGVVEVLPAVANLSLKSPLAGIGRRRFGGKTLLEWVVRRATEAHRLDQVVVLAGDDPLSRSLTKLVPRDVPVFVSSGHDPLERYADIARQFPSYSLVRTSVSSPFVDPILIDRLVNTALEDKSCDYATFCLKCGRSVMHAQLGFFAEWFRSEAILRADRLATESDERHSPTQFLREHSELFHLKFLQAPAKLDRDDIRLEIHEEEDWENLETIFEALGPESLDWQYITALLDRHPSICGRMRELNRAAPALLP